MVKFRNNKLFILLPIGAAVITCIGLTAVLAQLVLTGRVGEQHTEWAITLIILLSSLIGSLINRFPSVKNPMILQLTTLGVEILLMLVASLLIEGTYKNILMRFFALIVGGGVGCAISTKFHSRKSIRKRRHW